MSTSDCPPRAPRRPHALVAHGDERVDEYYWLRERTDPEVRAYLEAENAWTRTVLAATRELQETLYREMVGRIQEADRSAPYRDGPFEYYHRTFEGKAYAAHCRRPLAGEAGEESEQVLLDENVLAEGHEFFHLGAFEVSEDHRFLAYAIDTSGDEHYELRIRDLQTGEDLEDRIPDTADSLAWADDHRTLFYLALDQNHRPYRVMRHVVGTDPALDECVLQEDDERLFVSVHRDLSGAFLVVDISGHVTSEQWLLPASDPRGAFRVVAPRRRGVEYEVVHHDGRLFILTNDQATNFRLMEASCEDTRRESWKEVLPHRDDVYLTGVTALLDHLIVYERHRGLDQIRVRRLSTGEEHLVEFDEPAYTVVEGDMAEFCTSTLRFEYSSLVTPRSIYDYDLNTRERELVKRTPVRGGYDPSDYSSERIFARARDGTDVPISLVYRKGTRDGGPAPLLLYGYGSYGISVPPRFASDRLSLLDRGWIFAIAHVRGGGDLGRGWYEAAKFTTKERTFSDFVDCATHLIDTGYTASDRLAIMGGSAGGLLIGAALNMRKDLFKAAVLQVPFVDVLTTMLDENLPLTVSEYEEWGDPRDKRIYDAMRAYSPYDNLSEGAWPAMLVTAGWNDPRVQYWEPAKYVAKLRELKRDDAPLLLRTNLGAGHRGASGRYGFLRERAEEFAFLVWAVQGRGAGGDPENSRAG